MLRPILTILRQKSIMQTYSNTTSGLGRVLDVKWSRRATTTGRDEKVSDDATIYLKYLHLEQRQARWMLVVLLVVT